MRRRIYCSPESGPEDATTRWPYWGMEEWVEEPEILRVLRNDELWAKYEEAQQVVCKLKLEIYEQLIEEPWDADELRLGREAIDMLRKDYDYDRVRAIEDELLANAKLR